MSILKQKVIWGAPLALLSFQLYMGVLAGYFLAFFVAGKKTGERGKVRSLAFDLGSYRLHLHHWLLGSAALVISWQYDVSILTSNLGYGFMGGMIFQGVACYSDWHKVLIKKRAEA